VKSGYEFGLGVKNFNDLEESDTIEAFEERKRRGRYNTNLTIKQKWLSIYSAIFVL